MSLCYLDANATTFMPEIVIKTMIKWINKGNASSHYKSALECRNLMEAFKDLLLKNHGFTNHSVIFTSGASESNAHIITSTARSFMVKTGHIPHIIIGETEHKTILLCCEYLKNDGLCQYTKLPISLDNETYGTILAETLEAAIKPNTCLISIMTANNETGIVNNIPLLTSIAHKHKIPFHTDCVQSFSKIGVYNEVDACSISFHKLHGPPGLGCLIIRNNFINGYNIKALIPGSQNNGLRGGTENIPAIGASYAAYKYTYLKRTEKNEYVLMIKNYLKELLNKHIPCYYINDYEQEKHSKNKIFWISNKNENIMLCNTLLIAVYKDKFCNVKMKDKLAEHNIIISIGSACNSSNTKSSDVIYSLNIPRELRSGILRISLPDDISKENILYFITQFLNLLNDSVYD